MPHPTSEESQPTPSPHRLDKPRDENKTNGESPTGGGEVVEQNCVKPSEARAVFQMLEKVNLKAAAAAANCAHAHEQRFGRHRLNDPVTPRAISGRKHRLRASNSGAVPSEDESSQHGQFLEGRSHRSVPSEDESSQHGQFLEGRNHRSDDNHWLTNGHSSRCSVPASGSSSHTNGHSSPVNGHISTPDVRTNGSVFAGSRLSGEGKSGGQCLQQRKSNHSSLNSYRESHLLSNSFNMENFKGSRQLVKQCFASCTDEQKNFLLQDILGLCGVPQLHLLSVKLEEDGLHSQCPPNCLDLLTRLPTPLIMHILSYLPPEDLCRASEVCKQWHSLTVEPTLWRSYCHQPIYRLLPTAEHKQLISSMLPEGGVDWRGVFIDRYKLRYNWLIGRCKIKSFEGHTFGISCVQFDDTRIVSGSYDSTIKVWNYRTNPPWSVQTLTGHSNTVRCLHLEGNRLVSGSEDKTIKVWDLSGQQSWSIIACRVTLVGHLDTVRCLQVDDEKVVSGSNDFTLKIWDIRNGECLKTLRGHNGGVNCLQFNDSKIMSGSGDCSIKVWDFEGRCVRTLVGHVEAVTCLQFDSSLIISGSIDVTIRFWDINTGKCVKTIDWMASEGHTKVIRCLQADKWRLVSASDDRTIKVWDIYSGKRLVTLKQHTGGITCLQFNDTQIVSGSYDKTVRLWDFSV